MTDQRPPTARPPEPRARLSVAIIGGLFVFCMTAMALWAFTALGLMYALATAAPVTVVVTSCIVAADPVAEFFAAIIEGIGTAAAAILGAIAAVLSVFG